MAGAAIAVGYYANQYLRRHGHLEEEGLPDRVVQEDVATYEAPHVAATPPRTSALGYRGIFLSYRRNPSWPLAQLITNELQHRGFDVFVDVWSINNGQFEQVILAQIEARRHFLLLLESHAG